MKKKISGLFLTMAIAMIFFSACSNSDDVKIYTLDPTTYTDTNGLTLTYSGMSMLGKQAAFAPDAQDPTKGTLTLTGAEITTKTIVTRSSGVVPGVSTLTLNLSNIISEEGKISFEGTQEINNAAVTYKGTATTNSLNLDLNVSMPQNELAGKTFKLKQPAAWQTTPIYVNWKADEFPFNEGTWDMQSAISMVLAMTKIEEKSIPEMLTGVLNEVSFLSDGNIQASYKKGLEDANWQTSPLNLAMYTVNNGKIYLHLNMTQISAVSGQDLSSILGMVSTFVPGLDLSAGIPLAYSVDESNSMNIYLDTQFLLPILKVLKPLFEDEQMVNSIIEMLKSNAGEMEQLIDVFLKPVIVAFPNTIDTTTEVEIGLMFDATVQ